jgi:hypothetical protein
VRSEAEAEDLRSAAGGIEAVWIRVCAWIAVGGRQHDEHALARPKGLASDVRGLRQEAAGVLHRRVEAEGFFDDAGEGVGR